ncbi:LOW QUALITY PROTEIN: hypothetical protein V1478_016986 [Vespula squamosa]|uniref:Uncharacterized protein n=1 Tax=Vespula squamosa TaxID=30214 RepID=A0ABD1ZY82_VESSQ
MHCTLRIISLTQTYQTKKEDIEELKLYERHSGHAYERIGWEQLGSSQRGAILPTQPTTNSTKRRRGCKEDYLLTLLVDDANGNGNGSGSVGDDGGAVAVVVAVATSGGGDAGRGRREGEGSVRRRGLARQKRKGRMPFISSGLVGSHVVGAAPCDTSITGQPACNVGPTLYLNVLASCVCFCPEHQPCTILTTTITTITITIATTTIIIVIIATTTTTIFAITTTTIIVATVTTTTTDTTTNTVLLSYLPTYVLVPPCCTTGYIRDRHCIPTGTDISVIAGLNVELTTLGHTFISLIKSIKKGIVQGGFQWVTLHLSDLSDNFTLKVIGMFKFAKKKKVSIGDGQEVGVAETYKGVLWAGQEIAEIILGDGLPRLSAKWNEYKIKLCLLSSISRDKSRTREGLINY